MILDKGLKINLTSLFFSLVLVSSLNNTDAKIGIIGTIALMTILILSNASFGLKIAKSLKINELQFKLLGVSGLFLIILVVGILLNTTTRGLITILQFILLIGFTVSLSNVDWDSKKIKIIGTIISIFVLLHFLFWMSTGFEHLFPSVYNNSNLVGVYMLYSIFFLIWARMHSINKRTYTIILILALLVMYGSDTRTAILAGSCGILTYLLWNKISKNKFKFVTFLITVFTFLISLFYLYPKLPEWRYFPHFENFMIEYTGKSIMSGREYLWDTLLVNISDKPLLGNGTGILPREITDLTKSSHNFYLLITLQNGFLGLFVFLSLLLFIWLIFWKARDNKNVKLVGAFFIATLTYQSFEISLTQNLLSVGLIQWFIISIGISYCLKQRAIEIDKKS